ncbi:Rne/Rng family ribonuclease [Natroniella sulfidigena]|uniref:Rne/Rng family ribonuclease n=1 Tax=Natroniella sulfidigena TaxID=723921 RepID=UPI00200B4ECA|nr:Rne/Rng family ribonuclease [Natroniella sulfidigena]
MGKEIVVNAQGLETRVAILENRKLVEILFERDFSQQIVGNIYLGQVENVLPGMQSAFVDVGLEKNVFVHVKDIYPSSNKKRIEELLEPGQEILIQIAKESLGSKGPRGTCKLNIPGRYVVLLNYVNHVGVSRRIDDEEERKRLRQLAQDIVPNDRGIIVRTVAAYKSDQEIKRDLNFLLKIWDDIHKKAKKSSAPQLIHQDLNLIKQVVRDKFSDRIDKFILDTKEDYYQVEGLIDYTSPQLKSKIYYYNHPKPIFDHYDIEEEIESLLERKVWLNCGGYITIDTTEALTAVDVNTGKYVGKDNLQQTILKTNIEAAREISKQLRLRDIGGIIIIDFIDMKSSQDQDKVLQVLKNKLAHDKTKTNILGLTKLGLVEMTRKKEKERIGQFLQQDCSYCQGTGKILSEDTIVLQAIRKIREVLWKKKKEAILLEVHPNIAAKLIGLGGKNLEKLEKRLKKNIYIKGNPELHLETIDILKMGSREEIEKLALPVEVGDELVLEIEERHLFRSQDGIARLKGYIIDIKNGGSNVGKRVRVEITKVTKTYAQAKIIEVNN